MALEKGRGGGIKVLKSRWWGWKKDSRRCLLSFLWPKVYRMIITLDGPIHANQFADSRESPDSRESFPKGPNIEKIQDLEIFKLGWKFQASHPPPQYLWGILKVEIEIFKRDWKFKRHLFFSIFGSLRFQGFRTELLLLRIAPPGAKCCESQVFEVIRAHRLHVMEIGAFLQIDSRDSRELPRFSMRIARSSKISTVLLLWINSLWAQRLSKMLSEQKLRRSKLCLSVWPKNFN